LLGFHERAFFLDNVTWHVTAEKRET